MVCQKCGNKVKNCSFSIDINALRAITFGCVSFSIDLNALRAIACGVRFSIDMNALWAITEISRRGIISIERIRRMNCVVRRTLTTKSEHKFYNNELKFFTPHPSGGILPVRREITDGNY